MYTIGDFIKFCQIFDEKNGSDFKAERLYSSQRGFHYATCFWDKYHDNNHPINLYLEGGELYWDEPGWLEFEEDNAKPYFHRMISRLLKVL